MKTREMRMIEQKAHAELSASGSERWLNCPGSERWLNCPGSVKLSREAPPQQESKYALEGTLAHEHLESWLTSSAFKGKKCFQERAND